MRTQPQVLQAQRQQRGEQQINRFTLMAPVGPVGVERGFGRIASWLNPRGRFFAHVFCHHALTYPYEDRGEDDWMSGDFFSGGMMPSYDRFRRYAEHLKVAQHRWVNGQRHEKKTANAWRRNTDQRREELIEMMGVLPKAGCDCSAGGCCFLPSPSSSACMRVRLDLFWLCAAGWP